MQKSGIVVSKPPTAAEIPISRRIVGKSGEIAEVARERLSGIAASAPTCQIVLGHRLIDRTAQARGI
jgi:hypothetical protein